MASGSGRAAEAPVSFASGDLRSAVGAVPPGAKLRLTGVESEGEKAMSSFLLERFDVFTSDATITIHGEGGRTTVLPAPRNSYFRGTVEGEADSHVFLAVLADGGVQGIVSRGQRLSFIGSAEAPQALADGPLRMRDVAQVARESSGQGFTCGNSEMPDRPKSIDRLLAERLAESTESAESGSVAKSSAPLPAHTARVAIETDNEFYNIPSFNQNPTTIANYIANLIGYDSAVVYIPQMNTSLQVSSINLWATASDPWTQSSSTLCALMEFGYYWNKNNGSVSRTIAHFMSGKNLGGGVAFVGVLCSSPFTYSPSCPGLATDAPWGGGYGFTSSLQGLFSVNNPSVMWDNMAVAHEIGHNFDSLHSHCYGGIGGNANPIDQCSNIECGNTGCSCASPVLPDASVSGSGTIMSYCHLVRNQYSDIAMTFGTNFAYGVQPGREAALMSSYVTSVANGNPSCLALTGPAVSSISPAIGSTAGGQSVTISGSGFANGATVTIGGAAATSVVFQNSTTLTAVTAAHAAGVVTVIVTNPANGNAILLGGYTYSTQPPAPVVTSVTPPSGPLAGGTTVTIKGNNFSSGATATFAGASAVPTTFVDGSTLTATTPANTGGVKSVTVTNPDTSNGSLANGFFYADTGATDFYTLTPCRLVDTRNANGPLGGPVLAAGSTRLFTLAGVCGVPAGAKSLSLNVTVVAGTQSGALGLYPGDAFPLGTSTVNYAAGQTRANNVVMELATNGAGSLGVQNISTGTVHLVIDVNGYFQ